MAELFWLSDEALACPLLSGPDVMFGSSLDEALGSGGPVRGLVSGD